MSPPKKKNNRPGKRDLPHRAKTIYGTENRRNFKAQNPYALVAVCGFLLLAIGLVFGQTVRHDFINFDDDYYVYNNSHVAPGLSAEGIAWAFTTKHASNWHPLTWLSHMLDCQIYGLSPWGHHLGNVLLHAATTILLFLLLLRMTGVLWPSAFVAAVFAIHPLRVESVAWIAERKDVLSGLFFVLILWAYVSYVRRPFSLTRYLAVIVLFGLGLMAKPMLVTLPFVLLLLDYWPLGRMTPGATEDNSQQSPKKFAIPLGLIMEKIPLLALAIISSAATIWAQSGAIAIDEYLPLPLRIGNAVVSYTAYLGQFFYPAGLAVFYPHPESNLPAWKVLGAILILTAICVAVVFWRRRYPYLMMGWLWYLVMLFPVIGLVQVGLQAMADRYTYLPQIGLYIAIAWGAAEACRSWPHYRWVYGAASALVLAVMMGCAWRQTSFWRDSETLWTHTLACTSQNYIAHNNLGIAIIKAGRTQEAIEHYKQALQFNPDYPEAHYNIANALVQTGRSEEAIEHYEKVLRLKPDHLESQYNVGNALLRTGRPQEAIEHYRQALVLKPNYPEAHNNLGAALGQAGRLNEAIEHCQEAIRLKPDYAEAHYNLGNTLEQAGRRQEAIEQYKQVLELQPGDAEAHYDLGIALVQTGQHREAIEHFQQAVRIKPDFIEARNNLGLTLVKIGRSEEAIEQFHEALRLKPDNITVYANLALAHASLHQSAEAVASARKALELARSREQTAQAKKIEEWLNSYRAGLSE